MPNGEVDSPETFKPSACRHNVVQAGIGFRLVFWARCVSCDTDMTDYMMRVGKNYEYDPSHGWWVHVPKKKEKT